MIMIDSKKLWIKAKSKKISGRLENRNRRLESIFRKMLEPLPMFRADLNRVVDLLEKNIKNSKRV